MRSLSTRAIVERAADYYLASGDFNGYPIRQLARDFNLPEEELLSTAQKLVRRGRVTVLTSHAENPFIKRFPDAPKEKQLELLLASDLNRTCLYPSRSHVKRAVNRAKYKGRPFTLRLALGEPQRQPEREWATFVLCPIHRTLHVRTGWVQTRAVQV